MKLLYWFKYLPPIKEEIKEPVIAKDETIIYNADPVVPTAYIEKPSFPVRIKEHAKFQLWSKKIILEHLNQLNKSR